MRNRDFRRHHRARIRAKALRIINRWTWDEPPLTLADPWVYRRAENFTCCSCLMCCNPRRSKGWQGPKRTVQERRAPSVDDGGW